MTRRDRQLSRAIVASTGAALVLLTAGGAANAYSISETQSGEKVRWTATEVKFVLDESLSQLGPIHAVEALIREAFETWIIEAELPLDFTVEPGTCDEPGYDHQGANVNCIMACSDCLTHGEDVGARALVSHVSETGKIVDADIVFFTDAGSWSLGNKPGSIPLRSVTLHEVGHVLGLGHSDVERARMYSSISTGEQDTEAALHSDDVAGADVLYGNLAADVTTAGCGWRCAVASGTPGGLAGCVGFALLAALFLARRRR